MGKAGWEALGAGCFASRKAKKEGKDLIVSILYVPGTVLGVKKAKGEPEEKVSL